MDEDEELIHLDLPKHFLTFRDFVEFVEQEFSSDILNIIQRLLIMLLISTINDGKQQIHYKKQAANKINQKENKIKSARLIGWQHDVWVIGGRHTDQHVPGGVRECIHEADTLYRAFVK